MSVGSAVVAKTLRMRPADRSLARLASQVRACEACAQVRYSHVLGPANGPAPAPIMFLGEAPGRLGAGRSGVPFQGDESGRRFVSLLEMAGLRREDVFVTNALLCNPVDDAGRNRRPRLSEVDRCRPFLQAQIAALNPRIIVALGEIALVALRRIEPHEARLRTHAGVAVEWRGRLLVPLYHPGRRALVHRPEQQQREDWLRLAGLIEALTD